MMNMNIVLQVVDECCTIEMYSDAADISARKYVHGVDYAIE